MARGKSSMCIEILRTVIFALTSTFAGGDWSIIINSSSLWEEELDSGEERLFESHCPLVLSSLFSKPKFLETFDGSVEICGFTELSFTSGGEGAPVTSPPLVWGDFSPDTTGLLSELLSPITLFSEETEGLKGPGEVKEVDVKTEKGSTAAIKNTFSISISQHIMSVAWSVVAKVILDHKQ